MTIAHRHLSDFSSPTKLKRFFLKKVSEIKNIDNIMDVIDFEPIFFKMVHEENVTIENTVASLVKYIQFLILCKENKRVVNVPTEQIDKVWHLHILDTEKYEEDCTSYFGYFLHHFPYLGIRNKGDSKKLLNKFISTQKRFERRFEMPIGNEKSGDCSSRCGRCEGGNEPQEESSRCGRQNRMGNRPKIKTLFQKSD